MKKFQTVLLLLSLSCIAFAQTKEETAYFDNIVRKTIATPLPKGAKHKVISFTDKGYSISCDILQNMPVEGRMMEVSDGEHATLQGVYSVVNGKSVIHGRYDYKYNGSPVSAYGTFYVHNGADELIMKPRKAENLVISVNQIDIWAGYYNGFPCMLDGTKWTLDYKLSINAGRGGWCYTEVEAKIPKSIVKSCSHENIEAMLLSDTLNMQIRLNDGWKFSGNAVGHLDNTYGVRFTLLDGVKTKDFQIKEVKKANDSDGYIFRLTNPAHSIISEELLSLPASMENIDIDSLWSKSYYLAHSPEITIKYSNGDTYSGSFAVSDSIYPVSTTGTYTYKNGDKFIGDLSGAHYGGIPVDGKTIFNNGKEKDGNWLKEYEDELTASQFTSLYKEHAPSDVRDKAIALINENYFNKLVAKAEEYERDGNLTAAKNFYHLALARKNSSAISYRIKLVEDKIYRQELVDKYGSRFADNIINKRIETGMTKEMCELVLEETVGMEFYRESSWTDFGGNRIETWEYDFDYGVAQAKRELYGGTVDGLEEDGEEASLGEKAASALLSEVIMGFAGSLASPFADTMTDYKYLKFRNSVLVELKDSSFYDDINNTKRKAEDALNSLYWLLGE